MPAERVSETRIDAFRTDRFGRQASSRRPWVGYDTDLLATPPEITKIGMLASKRESTSMPQTARRLHQPARHV